MSAVLETTLESGPYFDVSKVRNPDPGHSTTALCPQCRIPIGELTRAGESTLLCPKCRYQFHVDHGQVVRRSSRQRTLQRETSSQRGIYEREYSLALITRDGSLEQIQFTTPGKEERVKVERGDLISVFFTLRGHRLEEIVSVVNHTRETTCLLNRPGHESRKLAWARAAVLAIIVFGTLTYYGVSGRPALLAGVVTLIVLRILFGHRLAPREVVSAHENAVIEKNQTLLEQKMALLSRRKRVRDDQERQEGVMERLVELRDKMMDVGEELYQRRICNIEKAMRLIEQQLELELRLLDQYDRAIKILEVEYETGRTCDTLPDEVSSALLVKLEELRAAEAMNSELDLMLSANEEVERLLA